MARKITPAERLHEAVVEGEELTPETPVNELDTEDVQAKILSPAPIKVELKDGTIIECKSRLSPADVNKRHAEAKIKQISSLLFLEGGKLSGDAMFDSEWFNRNFAYVQIVLNTAPNVRDAIAAAVHALSGKTVDPDDIKDMLATTASLMQVLKSDIPGAAKQPKKGGDRN